MYRSKLTRTVFSLYDLLQGHSISNSYKKIQGAYASQSSRALEMKSYIQYWQGKGYEFKDTPHTKEIIKGFINKNHPGKVHSWAYTGGSHGEPFKVPYSKERALLRTATFKFFNELGGYRVGDSFALIRAKNKSRLSKFLRNETVIIPHNISAAKLEHFTKVLTEKKVKFILGYPTVMHDLALFLKERPEMEGKLSVKSLISTSEMLDWEKRSVVKDVLCENFLDRYANEEVGLIAQQESFNGDYIVNPYNVIVEVLHPETLKPVKENETGKVVVTDTANKLAPMIRYDTGDLAIAGIYKDGELKTIRKVLGREVERIFDVSGNPVSSLALGPLIYKPLSHQELLISFQFAQVSSQNYELRLKAPESAMNEKLIAELITGLKSALGKEAKITIFCLANIPALPSGKRPIYVNEIKE